MSIFAPIYRPTRGQQNLVAHKQRNDRKRKWDDDGNESSDDGGATTTKHSPQPDAPLRPTLQEAVSLTDQYYVAGHPRHEAAPPPPFPHAPIKDISSHVSTEDELAARNPPIYLSKAAPDDHISSLKRRHVENVTTLLHTCMLRGDWKRASRVWGLLLRTEVGGRGMDVRQNGRWGIGAELLMRRKVAVLKPAVSSSHDDNDVEDQQSQVPSEFSAEGFRLAREYYERLILQHPHTAYTKNSVNALAFYPALFNTWVYDVQDRAKRKRQQIRFEDPSSPESKHSGSDPRVNPQQVLATIRKQELGEALPVAQRMDELMLSPPYDTSLPLLHLRGMVGLWLSDLYAGLDSLTSTEDEASEISIEDGVEVERNRERAGAEREKALRYLEKSRAAGADLPPSIGSMIDAMVDDT